jgi:hypothetical protein
VADAPAFAANPEGADPEVAGPEVASPEVDVGGTDVPGREVADVCCLTGSIFLSSRLAPGFAADFRSTFGTLEADEPAPGLMSVGLLVEASGLVPVPAAEAPATGFISVAFRSMMGTGRFGRPASP